MKEITMRIHKREANGEQKVGIISLQELDSILTPEEIFSMELVLNENLPRLRFHIEMRDTSSVPNPEFCRSKDICGVTGKCEAIRKYDRSCND